MNLELIVQIIKTLCLEIIRSLRIRDISEERIVFENLKIKAYKEDMDAQYKVGITLMKVLGSRKVAGEDYKANEREGIKWLKKAAEQGHRVARYKLGIAYEEGTTTISPDEREAFRWYEKAGYQDYLPALSKLAYMYKEGIGTDINMEKSEEWDRRVGENLETGGKRGLNIREIMEKERVEDKAKQAWDLM